MLAISGLFLVANLISNFLFGAYTSVAINCVGIFFGKFRSGPTNWVHLLTFIVITLVVTIKVMIDNVITVNAFTKPDENGKPQYPAYDSVEILTLNALWTIETIIADAFIIYRVWVVWRKKWVVTIFPSILLVGCLAAGTYSMYVRHNPGTMDPIDYMRILSACNNAFMSLTLGLNILCTGLVAFRIWHVRSRVSARAGATKRPANDPVAKVINIIVESAAIYTIHLLLIIALRAAGSPLSALFVPIVSPTIALVFGSIIVRSVSGVAVGNTTHASEMSTQVSAYNRNSTQHGGTGKDSSETLPTGKMQVKLERVVTSMVDIPPHQQSEGGPEKYGHENV